MFPVIIINTPILVIMSLFHSLFFFGLAILDFLRRLLGDPRFFPRWISLHDMHAGLLGGGGVGGGDEKGSQARPVGKINGLLYPNMKERVLQIFLQKIR